MLRIADGIPQSGTGLVRFCVSDERFKGINAIATAPSINAGTMPKFAESVTSCVPTWSHSNETASASQRQTLAPCLQKVCGRYDRFPERRALDLPHYNYRLASERCRVEAFG